MKTPPGRPSPRYRNEIVFRSAQRLASSRHVSPARTSRLGIRVAGACALLLVGVLIGRYWAKGNAPELPPQPALAGNPANAQTAPSPTSSAQPHTDAPADPSPAASPKPAPIPAHPAEAPHHTPDLAISHPAPTAISSRDTSESAATPPVSIVTETITLNAPSFTLRGILSSDRPEPPRELELSLQLRGRTVFGVIRYFSSDGQRVAANTVHGSFTERTVQLREKDRVWASPSATSDLAPALTLIFELPENTLAPPPSINGRWTRGSVTGQLTLAPAAPW